MIAGRRSSNAVPATAGVRPEVAASRMATANARASIIGVAAPVRFDFGNVSYCAGEMSIGWLGLGWGGCVGLWPDAYGAT